MVRFIAHRTLYGAAALLLIVTATFFLMHAIPGGPYSRERALPPAVEANLLKRYRLDEPVPVQFVRYLGALVRGDLGPSFVHEDRTVNQIIAERLPRSAALGVCAFILAMGIGVPLGIAAALRVGRAPDRALMVLAVMGVSVPSFIVASLLQYVFSYRLGWIPAAGWGTPLQLLLPSIALAGFKLAFVSRLVRSSMVAVLAEDYVRTARAKGLPGRVVVLRHALRNALLPAITYAGPMLAALLTGSFVVEDIFAIPGLGASLVTSISDRDYTVTLGLTIFYSALLIGLNVVVDVVYGLVDPRLRPDQAETASSAST
jgi:oligopeptide transport system permease protein